MESDHGILGVNEAVEPLAYISDGNTQNRIEDFWAGAKHDTISLYSLMALLRIELKSMLLQSVAFPLSYKALYLR